MQEPGATEPRAAEACTRCGAPHPATAACPSGATLAFAPDAPAAAGAPPEPQAAPQVDPLVGSLVGSFRVVRLLGRGGMGTVYLAEHPVIGSRVAVKLLHESMASDPAIVARFYDEARAVNLIGHENIVGIYDLGLLPPSRYYIVMEYLEGDTLEVLLRAGPVPPSIAREVLLQLCDALQAAHDHGVVHRDLKPENVFLVRRPGKAHVVKLVDFGIAKLRGAGATGHTQAGFIVGTPEYMAPEQCEEAAVDARTDVYALGVMAFELATGRLPFQGRSIPQLLLAHLREAPPRPTSLAPVEPALEAILLRALAKDPADRFPDMASFAAALRALPAPRHVVPAPPEGLAPAPAASAARTETLADPVPAPVETLAATVTTPGAPPARMPVAELTRGGLFLRAERALPPLRAGVHVSLAHASLRAALELDGEVVRHVSAADAAAWGTAPGFALQFLSPTPEARAALAALADELRRDTPAPAPRSAAAVSERLGALEVRRTEGHYALLGLAPDAEFADVRRALRTLREELEGVRARPLAPDHPARAVALLARLDAAQEALGSPAARLAHDARRGNAGGVARCLAAGVPAPLVEARRRELLAEDPGRAAEARRQLARAEVARKLGNAAAAALAFEAALAADPLDPAAREAYATFRRARARGD